MTNTKQTPKSCSCSQCKYGKHTKTGHFYMKVDERAYRHASKIALTEGKELQFSGPVGNYFD